MGALRIAAAVGIFVGLLMAAVGLVAQRTRADGPIKVPTRAEVVGALRVTIDINPGSNSNTINQPCGGDIPVAILSTAGFDASIADSTTATFAQAPPTHSAMEDVDGDGGLDLVLHFSCQEVSIPRDATEVCLQGRTKQGASIEGCDFVTVVSQAGLEDDRPAAIPAATSVPAGAVHAPAPFGGDESGGGWPWLFLLLGGGLALTVLVGLVSFLRPRRS